MNKIALFFLSALLIFNLSALSYSQDEPSTASDESVSVDNADLSSQPQNQQASQPQQPATVESQKIIKNIEIKGNKVISTSTIISKIKTRISQPYYSRVAQDDIKRLYETGFFSDVSIDFEEDAGGIKVIISVTEKPIVEKITFEGIRILRKDLLERKTLKTKAGQYLDYNQLKEDIQSIKNEYQKKGYSETEVNYDVQINKDTEKADVVFRAVESKRIRIKRVYVKGNDSLKRGKIIKAMKTRQARIFHAGFLKEGELQDDLDRVKILYNTEGFADAAVDYKVEKGKKGWIYIYLTVEEGKKYIVGSVNIAGNKDFSAEELKSKLKEATQGKVFSELGMQQDVYNLRDFYLGKGYLFVQLDESASVNTQTGNVDITYSIKENEIAYVERIDIRGNVKTKDKVIRREVRLKPGDRFDGEKLKRSRERLNNLGYFEEVVFDNEAGTKPNQENLIVDVKEAQTGSFSFGGGYSTVDQFIGFVEVEQKNFDLFNFPNFTGGGQDLLIRSELGSVTEDFLLSFTEPWLFDRPISGGFDAYRKIHDKENDVGYSYSEKRTGGDLRLGREFSEYLKGNIIYRMEDITISDVDDDSSQDLKKEIGTNTIMSLQFGLTHDTRDNIFDPRKGTVLSGSIECAGGPFGGDKDFLRLYNLADQYFGLTEKSVLEAKFESGWLFTYGDTSDIPIYERFYAGGANTIRGYDERGVSPVDELGNSIGGESVLIFSLEHTYALLDFLKFATFVDTGNTWRKVEDYGSGGFKSGVGFGFRVKTPLGPIKVDYGIPLNKEPGETDKGSGKFHFSMG
ncbi:MAG: outer membrane protein assembly factor BamA, partial [Candidatus Omnitrophica bacterium]|nr:outer membrane protein assembly factor BamA [Candidatus Omnitrophota bacterium]